MSARSIVISPLDAADLAVVAALAHRIWPAAYAGVLTGEQIANLLLRIYSVENLKREMASGHRFWLAREGGAPAGFASGYKEGSTVWLKKLYVLPDRQGRGLGRALMDAVVAAFLPADDLKLFVNNGNTAAQAFYERLGFSRAAEVPVRMGDFDFVDFVYAKRLGRPTP